MRIGARLRASSLSSRILVGLIAGIVTGLFIGERAAVLQAGMVFIGDRLAFAIPAFAAINVVLAGAWLGVAMLLNRELRRKSGT